MGEETYGNRGHLNIACCWEMIHVVRWFYGNTKTEKSNELLDC